MSNEEIDETVRRLVGALKEAGAHRAEAADPEDALHGDVYVEWYLSDLLEFCQDWRSEIEELG